MQSSLSRMEARLVQQQQLCLCGILPRAPSALGCTTIQTRGGCAAPCVQHCASMKQKSTLALMGRVQDWDFEKLPRVLSRELDNGTSSRQSSPCPASKSMLRCFFCWTCLLATVSIT